MTIESTRADLLAIERAHQDNHDGGYHLASALCEYRRDMPEHAAGEWDQVLLGWVRDEPARFWGVALEALARAGGSGVNDELAAMLREASRNAEWREYVAHTLIRRGASSRELTLEVEEAARRMSPMGLANLAALLGLVPDLLSSAVACVVAAMSSGKYEYVEANIPPFVYAAADSDPELLLRLIRQTEAEDREAGRRFGKMVAEYLGRPFVQRRFPEGVAAEMAEKIRRLAMS